MIMRDTVIIEFDTGPETVRAIVGVTTGGVEGNSDYGYYFIEELRLLMDPDPRVQYQTVVKWRGDIFTVLEPPIIRRKSGRDHHITCKLERRSV